MLVGKLTYLFGQFFFGILGNSVGGRLAFFNIDRFVMVLSISLDTFYSNKNYATRKI